MGNDTSPVPIEASLPEIGAALAARGQVVIQAPPGAGKTTRLPLWLLEKGLMPGRILMLEPRRIAARSAAEFMAARHGSALGQTIGYRTRGDSRTSASTRIEVVTEGILTRMIQSDPELTGITCVIFDEFHERSLNADLGLALCLEIRAALRPDLHLIVMSATFDAAPVAELMGNAPVVTSAGTSFPVETRWLSRPADRDNITPGMAGLVKTALAETQGSILAFLPGEREIRRLQGLLADCGAEVLPLYGALPWDQQRRALAPSPNRRVILATSIAETSLTLPGITAVVDSGLARRSRFSPGTGMSRLITERASRAEADQRRGRAGRLGPGICYRLWTKAEEGGMPAFAPPEITDADLAPLALELALWGGSDLPFLTPPPAPLLAAGRDLLTALAALDANARITPHGRALAALPIHPRLGHMLLAGGGPHAASLAALLQERDLLLRDGIPGADLSLRLDALRHPATFERDHPFRIDRAVLARLSTETTRLRKLASPDKGHTTGTLLALAYPDRIGQRRKGDAPRFLLSGGKGAFCDEADALGRSPMIVAAELDGDTREARVRLGLIASEAEIRQVFAGQITTSRTCIWNPRDKAVEAAETTRLGALTLDQTRWNNPPADAIAAAMTEGIRQLGLSTLPWTASARSLCDRCTWLRQQGRDLPDMSDPGLTADLATWLQPALGTCRKLPDLTRLDLRALLENRLDWPQRQVLEAEAPPAITAPTGTRLTIDYSGPAPQVSVRLQEMFGTTTHPVIGKVPILFDLLSPGGKSVQKTADIPGFWSSSYPEVRRDLRGRYPRHSWPEDPAQALPTTRAKPRPRS